MQEPTISYSMDGYLKELLGVYRVAVHKKNTSAVIIFDGRSGMGKTTLANQVGRYCDEKFGLDKIFYDPDKFIQALAEAKPGDFILFDEAMLISNRSALSQINRMIIQAMSMIRSKRLFVGFCVNSIFDLDRNLAISRADLLLHVYGDHLFDRGKFCAFFKAKDGHDRIKDLYLLGKKYYSYSRPKANFFGSFTKHFVVDEVEYEKRKQEGVNKFLKTTSTDTSKAKRGRDKLIRYLYNDLKYPVDRIAEISGLSISPIYEVVKLQN